MWGYSSILSGSTDINCNNECSGRFMKIFFKEFPYKICKKIYIFFLFVTENTTDAWTNIEERFELLYETCNVLNVIL